MEIILGIGASLVIQFLKGFLKLGEYATIGAVVVISLGLAALYAYLQSAGMLDATIQILTTAGAFYTFILKRFEK